MKSRATRQISPSPIVHCKVCINFINKPWYHRFLQGDISYDITLWPGVLNFQIRFVNGSNSVLLPITCTFKALKTFLPELLPFNFLFLFLNEKIISQDVCCVTLYRGKIKKKILHIFRILTKVKKYDFGAGIC